MLDVALICESIGGTCIRPKDFCVLSVVNNCILAGAKPKRAPGDKA